MARSGERRGRQVRRAFLNIGEGLFLESNLLDGAFDFIEGGEADEGIAGAHVEVDVGQRLDLVVGLELGDEFEEEAQLADLYGSSMMSTP